MKEKLVPAPESPPRWKLLMHEPHAVAVGRTRKRIREGCLFRLDPGTRERFDSLFGDGTNLYGKHVELSNTFPAPTG